MTDKIIKLFGRFLLIGFAAFVWVRPLFYAYHHSFLFDLIQFGLWGLSILLLLVISIKLKPFKINGFIIIALCMMTYPFFHLQLADYSEKIFFDLRKNEMENIVADINNNTLQVDSEQLQSKIKELEIKSIEKGENYIAFAVNSFIDNADGFVYIKGGDLPTRMFAGNLIYKDSIAEHWYAFSSR